MQYFEVILENGHIGAGNSYEVKRYFKGSDMLSVISKVKGLPRIKKRHTIEAVKEIRPITKEEYVKDTLKNTLFISQSHLSYEKILFHCHIKRAEMPFFRFFIRFSS
ncbi:MAG: hypothetical protein HZB81_06085 [Deltaproteobacteria bacterium]|nr:hypothetical protein [Deltaproteobacteria bacterium]